MAEREAALERLEVVRRWVELSSRGDWVKAWHDPDELARSRAFFEEVAVPELEVVPVGVEGEGGLVASSRGFDGLVAFWQEWLAPWETFTVELGGIVEGRRGVLLDVVQRGRLQGSSATVETPSAAVHFFAGDRLARIEFHIDRAHARRAAGLPPASPIQPEA